MFIRELGSDCRHESSWSMLQQKSSHILVPVSHLVNSDELIAVANAVKNNRYKLYISFEPVLSEI